METYWPCVGAERVVPDYISLFPGSQEVAPFAGATRHLCDRKEVTLDRSDLGSRQVLHLHSDPHRRALHRRRSRMTSLRSSIRSRRSSARSLRPPTCRCPSRTGPETKSTACTADQMGRLQRPELLHMGSQSAEPDRLRADHDGGCMNDSVMPIRTIRPDDPDPLYHDGYSQFCYELPFMPGQTGYMDTPVVPTSAFAGGYNRPDCAYPDATPAISEVDGRRRRGAVPERNGCGTHADHYGAGRPAGR